MEKERKGSSRKVMVAIDESDFSYNALIWVLENLKDSITDTPLVLFATQPLVNLHYAVSASLGFSRFHFNFSPTVDLINQNQQRNMKVSLGLLEKAKSICANRGLTVKTFTEAGDPKVAICNAVQEHDINLLVVGDKSNDDVCNGILKRALLGSTLTDYCLSNAKCPVLVVKKPK